jgi:RNA polymerase sigma-70 factor (ECF subfamily)
MMPDTGGEWEMLLVAANAGDGQAFLRFLTAITPVVRKVVQARGRALAPDQREDIVQEVLLAVHLKRQTWQAGMPVRPWLYAVCRHKVADAFRRRGTQVHLPIEDFEEALAGEEGPDPLAARDADALLSRLDGRSAEIVRALSLRGESAESVGARHAMSEGAVRVAFHRAMKRLVEIGRRMND